MWQVKNSTIGAPNHPAGNDKESEAVQQLRLEVEELKKTLNKEQQIIISLKQEFLRYLHRRITSDFLLRCQHSDKWMRTYISLT